MVLALSATIERPTASAAPAPPGTWIVTLQDGVPVDSVAGAVRAPIRQRFTAAVTAFSAALTPDQLSRLDADPRVRSVTENAVVAQLPRTVRRASPVAPSTQFVPEGVRRVGGTLSPTARIDGVEQRIDADIAVIDTGVDMHPDLRVVAQQDCTGEGITADTAGHGTEVAGVAAARDNRIGTVGVAPGAGLWGVRIFDAFGNVTLESLLCSLDYVRKNADRIDAVTLAFENEGARASGTVCGITTRTGRERGGTKYQVVDPVDLAICRGTAAGLTFVASAGNDSADAASFVPAAYPEVITVSATSDTDGLPGGRGAPPFCFPTEDDDTFASFSNFGRVVDLAAPGVCAYTTYPGGLYTTDVGTSFSAPLVAGAAALIRARDPRASFVTVYTRLQQLKERGPILNDPDGIPEGLLNAAKL
ncbi:S8 family peptidase [Actinomycetospora atypica]|uniref:S8 family serine peptidase n=1 Tax=Actinomycetospora atypica TaxID=1290095 RepID=A0ABV9YIB4_9PSEU